MTKERRHRGPGPGLSKFHRQEGGWAGEKPTDEEDGQLLREGVVGVTEGDRRGQDQHGEWPLDRGQTVMGELVRAGRPSGEGSAKREKLRQRAPRSHKGSRAPTSWNC